MIDSHSTTLDWQRHTGEIAVLGVGSCEQHGAHLPLETDAIQADYFARWVAEELDAALLPTLRIANSLEHTGFRGSISLRPETLMQVIRDIAAELARQRFRVLVLVNSHGGNFALTPVVRDLNRQDGLLKIIQCDTFRFRGATPGDQVQPVPELHAGEAETSLMLAIAPELVGDRRLDAPSQADQPVPLLQSDLSTFGVGYFAPAGPIGTPSQASRAQGEALLALVKANMMTHLHDRLERLHRNPRYAGPGGLALRRLLAGDLSDAMALKESAHWNQTRQDWQFLLATFPETMFAAVHDGRVVATAGAVAWDGKVGWIGMVLVDPQFRRMALATRLMTAALESVADCALVGLDATPDGQLVYEKIGFRVAWSFARYAGVVSARPLLPSEPQASALEAADLTVAAALDQVAFGANRQALLEHLYERAPECAWKITGDAGQLTAFTLGRDGSHAMQIGPVVADSEHSARSVLTAALARLAGRQVVIDVPGCHLELIEWLAGWGLQPLRPFTRMYRGEPGQENLAKYFAVAGPELG